MDPIRSILKAQLHVHLEGSVRRETLQKITLRKGIPPLRDDIYRFGDFEQFNRIFPEVFSLITTEEDFYEIALAFAEELVRENVVYCESFCVPLAHVRRGIALESFLPPILAALEDAQRRWGIQIRLIYSIVRFGGHTDWGMQTLDLFEKFPEDRIVGIDLSGPESLDTIRPFEEVFQRARSLGLHCTAHAGEFCGPTHIRETLGILRPERIGHGIGAVEDPVLIRELIDRDIPLEICPESNYRLRAVPREQEHPIRFLFDQGVPIVLSTDDPAFFECTLCGQYEQLRDRWGFQEEEIRTLIENSFRYAFKKRNG